MASGRSFKCSRSCSIPFLLSPLLILWGICVLSTSLVTLAVTSSYRGVFPFGAPLWTGTLYLISGCFLLFAYKITDSLALTSKAHVWFTLSLGLLTMCESLLALALSLWHYLILSPVLPLCSPDSYSNSGGNGTTCECTEGFINPPSLTRIVHRFEGVTNCTELGDRLQVYYNILTGMYALGVVLAVILTVGACKKLHTLGVCGASGVYTITPATSMPATSRQGSPDLATTSTHLSSTTVTGQYNLSSGQSTLTIPQRFTGTPSYLISRRHAAVVTAPGTGNSRNRLTSTGSIYQSAMI